MKLAPLNAWLMAQGSGLAGEEAECLQDPARRAEACGLLDDMQARVGVPAAIIEQATAEILALEFARTLRAYLTDAEMAECIARNRAETSPGVCHSHDFCDANDAMAEAHAACDMPTCVEFDESQQPEYHERACRIWSLAWDIAQRSEFAV
jgi:hypothetical protein